MNWHEYFYYENGLLIWKTRPHEHFIKERTMKIWNSRFSGLVAGTRDKNGYISIGLDCEKYYAHRVIWEMHNGQIQKGMQIDHINHIRDDNVIENLRLVSGAQNSKNMSMSIANKTGRTGVYMLKNGKYCAMIVVDRKSIYLGCYENRDDAFMARDLAE